MRKSVFAAGMIGGPVLFLAQALLTPTLSNDAVTALEAMAGSASTDLRAVVSALAMLGLIAAFLGLRQLTGDSGLALVATGLAVAGMATQPIWIGIDVATEAIAATGTGAEQVAVAEAINASGGALVAIVGAMAYVVGVVLLAVALARSKAIALPFAALIGLFPILMIAGFAGSMNSLLIAGGVAATLGMAPVGFKLLGDKQALPAAAPAA